MTTPIVLFLVFGACFGWVTFHHRHLFSEGPTRRSDQPGTPAERAMWVMVCTCLWPLMGLTGLYSLWRLRRMPVRTPHDPGR